MSGDGSKVALWSSASNLVPHDTNGFDDVFVYDRRTGVLTIESTTPAGAQANSVSTSPFLCRAGRHLMFTSPATNLVPGDTNGVADVFVKDLETGALERVSVSSSEVEGDDISIGGQISDDGRYAVFWSRARNLGPSPDPFNYGDVFLRDRVEGTTTHISSTVSGGFSRIGRSVDPQITPDGRYILYASEAHDIVPGDHSGYWRPILHDRVTGLREIPAVDSDERQYFPSSYPGGISGDGRYVVFSSYAPMSENDFNGRERDVFLRDRARGVTELISVSADGFGGNGPSEAHQASVSDDGRYVAFTSRAGNLVPWDDNQCGMHPFPLYPLPISCHDVFVRDRLEAETHLVSVSSSGERGNQYSHRASISPDGTLALFLSAASNLVPDDTNRMVEVFIHDRRACSGGSEPDGTLSEPMHETVEPLTWPVSPVERDVTCDVLVPNGW